jgi:hypothetical protein
MEVLNAERSKIHRQDSIQDSKKDARETPQAETRKKQVTNFDSRLRTAVPEHNF